MLGTTNGRTKCNECDRIMPRGEKIWVDMEEQQVYCMGCRDEDGNPMVRPKEPVESTKTPPEAPVKKVVVEHRSKHREERVKELERRVTVMEGDLKRLKVSFRALLEVVRRDQNSGKNGKKELSFEEERLALRRQR